MSLLLIENVPREERARALGRLGAVETELVEGETLYIPPCWWHDFQYLDASMSLSFRLDHPSGGSRLMDLESRVHTSGALSCLAQRFVEGPKQDASLPGLDRLLAAARRATPGAAPRPRLRSFARVEEAVERMHASVCREKHVPAEALDGLPARCWAADSFAATPSWERGMAKRYY